MVVEVALLYVVLVAAPQKRGVGESQFTMNSWSEIVDHVQCPMVDAAPLAILFSKSLEHALAEDLGLIPDVRHVLVERADDDLLVWISLDNPTREIRERVFQKQFDLIEAFPEVSFDFNLVSAKNRTPEEFASNAQLIYSRKDV